MADTPCRLIAGSKCWIEGAALEQLRSTAQLPGMLSVVGLPDLHPGKNAPIGAAYLNRECIYPHLVGNDIGCGMALWQSALPRRKKKPERWLKKLQGLDEAWTGEAEAWLQECFPDRDWAEWRPFAAALGSIGGGNHFAELQEVVRIHEPEALAELGLNPENLFLLVHSGSRGLGESILRQHVADTGGQGLPWDGDAAQTYVQAHDAAVAWAQANRRLIARRFFDCLGLALPQRPLLDLCHNAVWQRPEGFLHRKGAAPADQGVAIIPGSRGASSYLVRPRPSKQSLWSLAHGAGRKWRRSDSKARLQARDRPEDLYKTKLGSWVICENRHLLYEEAPEAYKSIDQVVQALVEAELLDILAELHPVITYKTRRKQ